jgi:hypothetical protein
MKPSTIAFCFVVLGSAGLVGCGESHSTLDPDPPPVVAPANPYGLELAGLESLSVSVTGGMPTPSSQACGGNHADYAVDLGAKQLAWSTCDMATDGSGTYFVNQGSRTLSAAELRAVNLVLENHLSLSHSTTCGFDAPDETLTLTFASHTDTYWDDYYAGCQYASQSGRTYISGLSTLVRLLAGASQYASVPRDFETLELIVEPYPSSDLSWMETCDSYDESKYALDASTQQLRWALCRSPARGVAYATVTGSRILSETEFATVRAGLGALVLGADGDCATVRADKWISLSREGNTASFGSDVGACSPSRGGIPPFVVGLDVFAQTVASLAANGS